MERRNLTIYVNEQEFSQIEQVRKYHLRRTYADTLRFLIAQEAEKILSQNKPNGLNQPQPAPSAVEAPPAKRRPTVEELAVQWKRGETDELAECWLDLADYERTEFQRLTGLSDEDLAGFDRACS